MHVDSESTRRIGELRSLEERTYKNARFKARYSVESRQHQLSGKPGAFRHPFSPWSFQTPTNRRSEQSTRASALGAAWRSKTFA